MATRLFLRQTTANRMLVSGRQDLLLAAGAGATEATVNTVASGTEIQWTDVGAGQVLEWVSPPLAAGFTLLTSDVLTFNIWARESNMNANAAGRARVYRITDLGALVEIGGGPFNDGVEFGTSDGVFNWTGSPSSNVTFVAGDRFLVRYFITNSGPSMGGGHTCTLSYDGATGGADGDSYLELSPTVTFMTETPSGIVLPFGPLPPVGVGGLRGSSLCPDHAWFFAGNVQQGAIVRDRVGTWHGTFNHGGDDAGRKWYTATQAAKCTSKASGVTIGVANALPLPTADVTILVVARAWVSNPGDNNAWHRWSEVPAAAERIGLGAGSTTVFFDMGSVRAESSAIDPTAPAVYVGTGGPRGTEVWRDGRLLVQAAASSRTNPASALTYGIVGGGLAMFSCAYLWNRQLTPSEIVEISRAPW